MTIRWGERMGKMDVHFSSKSDSWETPQDFFDKLNDEFKFELDVCADEFNAKCLAYFSKKYDGLKQDWTGACWMNPPYGREIGKWVQKAYESALGGQRLCVSYLAEQIQNGGMNT